MHNIGEDAAASPEVMLLVYPLGTRTVWNILAFLSNLQEKCSQMLFGWKARARITNLPPTPKRSLAVLSHHGFAIFPMEWRHTLDHHV